MKVYFLGKANFELYSSVIPFIEGRKTLEVSSTQFQVPSFRLKSCPIDVCIRARRRST